MRIQDKVKGHRIARQKSESLGFAALGTKIEDELPVPHHSGYVAVEEDDLVFDHQKITDK
jgi:NADH-quinone oxidoreductase subunit B